MAEEGCNVCDIGVSIGIIKKLCQDVADGEKRTFCDEITQKVLMGEITINEFISNVKEIVKDDEEANFTVDEVKKLLERKKVI